MMSAMSIQYVLSKMEIEDVKDKYKHLHPNFMKQFKRKDMMFEFEVGFEENDFL